MASDFESVTGLLPKDIESLLKVGTALMAEHDLKKLLSLILRKSRKILKADAGSIFLVEFGFDGQPKSLRLELAQNDSMEAELHDVALDINHQSLVGYVAATKSRLLINDVYNIDPAMPYHFLKTVDEQTGYRSKSLLSVPLVDHKSTLIGVIQLWNRKNDPKQKLSLENTAESVVGFTDSDCLLLESLASQAAIAIENAKLYKDIETLFEGFIRASVLAIESRDPTTSGHSERVAKLTVALAQSADKSEVGIFKHVTFTQQDLREIQYASLLHDFGKIGVKESILLKAKKLYPLELEVIRERFALMQQQYKINLQADQIKHLTQGGTPNDATWQALEKDYQVKCEQLNHMYEMIYACNEPTVMSQDISKNLAHIKNIQGTRPNGTPFNLIEPDQINRLSILRGSLSEKERLEIEAHVSYTFEFLNQIPWTAELQKVPHIAHAHHEKLNGSGYPRKASARDIPVASQLMAVTDIYDALVARDRPYKKAIGTTKAIEILKEEAHRGLLHTEIVELFVAQKIYRITSAS